jgi:hypothetical protein
MRVTREEFRKRRAALRPILHAFQHGRLETGGSGGNTGMMFIRTPDGKQWFFGGVHDTAVAHALVEAVNFALDLCETPDQTP